MFALRSKGHVLANEELMLIKDFDGSGFNPRAALRDARVSQDGWWRTGEYAFYRRGFEKKDLWLGERLVYVDRGLVHVLDIPDVPATLANGKRVGLRQATGMGVFRLEKLRLEQIDDKTDVVSVTTGFDPAIDVKVVDIMRQRAWSSLVDGSGYPLKSEPSGCTAAGAKYSWLRQENLFEEGSSGYHGSVGCGISGVLYRRFVMAYESWSDASGVAVIDRKIWDAADPARIETLQPSMA
jgi:hypothetical protein